MNLTLLHELKIPNYRSEIKVKKVKKTVLLPAVPSWNYVIVQGQWGIDKLKKEIAHAFLSALRACADDSSTKTTLQRSTASIAADTLAGCLQTRQEQRKLRQRNARLKKAKKNTP